jgi:hypothetical protein
MPDTRPKPGRPGDVASPPPPDASELPPTHWQREDHRWGYGARYRDWLILLVMMLIYLVWMGAIYLFEPGIR